MAPTREWWYSSNLKNCHDRILDKLRGLLIVLCNLVNGALSLTKIGSIIELLIWTQSSRKREFNGIVLPLEVEKLAVIVPKEARLR